MVVAIDETGNDRHLPGIKRLRALSREPSDFTTGPERREAPVLDRECFRPGKPGLDRMHLRVEYDQIGRTIRLRRERRMQR